MDIVPHAGISKIVVKQADGELVHGFGGTVSSFGPYVITFDRDIHVNDKGKLTVDIVLQQAGLFNSVHIQELLPKFSTYTLHAVELMEDL